MSKFNLKRGVGVVEVLVGSAILVLVLFAFVSSLSLYSEASRDALKHTQALFLAEEGLELARAIRDEDWNNIKNLKSISSEAFPAKEKTGFLAGLLGAPTVHGLVAPPEAEEPDEVVTYKLVLDQANSTWILEEGVEEVGDFTRKITIHDVYRNSDGEITDTISEMNHDNGTREVRVEVSWESRRGTQSVALGVLLTEVLSR